MSGREACQLSMEVGFLLPRILSRNYRPAKSGEKKNLGPWAGSLLAS